MAPARERAGRRGCGLRPGALWSLELCFVLSRHWSDAGVVVTRSPGRTLDPQLKLLWPWLLRFRTESMAVNAYPGMFQIYGTLNAGIPGFAGLNAGKQTRIGAVVRSR